MGEQLEKEVRIIELGDPITWRLYEDQVHRDDNFFRDSVVVGLASAVTITGFCLISKLVTNHPEYIQAAKEYITNLM